MIMHSHLHLRIYAVLPVLSVRVFRILNSQFYRFQYRGVVKRGIWESGSLNTSNLETPCSAGCNHGVVESVQYIFKTTKSPALAGLSISTNYLSHPSLVAFSSAVISDCACSALLITT